MDKNKNLELDNKEVLSKEIDLIQNCITRMAQNSFSIKGWLIGLIIAVIALLPENVDKNSICWIIIATTIIFWGLDAFYLRTEKLYRWKYDWIIQNRLNTSEFCYNLNPDKSEMWLPDENNKSRKKPCIIRTMFTKTLWPFYMPIIIIALGVIFKEQLVQFWCNTL